MALTAGVFLDTSVLVAGMVDFGEASRSPFRVLDAVARGELERPLTAWHCCLEFFSVTTRLPGEYRLTSAAALRLIEEEILSRCSVHDLPPDRRPAFLTSLAAEGLVGGRIYDAHIGEVARMAGARTVVTDNRRHFTALLRHGIPILTSAELAAELGPERGSEDRGGPKPET
jgi:predicted nucleic acid-binding protein